jgi:hypothetical protein
MEIPENQKKLAMLNAQKAGQGKSKGKEWRSLRLPSLGHMVTVLGGEASGEEQTQSHESLENLGLVLKVETHLSEVVPGGCRPPSSARTLMVLPLGHRVTSLR